MEYLGELGRLIPLRCASAESEGSGPRYSMRTTAEGRRRAQIIPASPRAWDVRWGAATPGEVTALSDFLAGAWGVGPWHWVPIQAHQGNLLTPAEAACMTPGPYLAAGGPVVGADGVMTGSSYLTVDVPIWAPVAVDIPVLEGRAITFSADVLGDGNIAPQLVVAFYNAAGVQVSVSYQAGNTASGMQRVSQTRTPGAGAVSARVGVRSNVIQVARPQVTWTDSPVPFEAGHGCRAAVVDGVSQDLLSATPFGTFSAVGFTVMEVG